VAGDEARGEARGPELRADERSRDGHRENSGSEPSETEPLMPNCCGTSGGLARERRAEEASKGMTVAAPAAPGAVGVVAPVAGETRTLK